MISLDMPAATITVMQEAAADATIAAARAFGFGGEEWTQARPSGSGVAARTLTTLGTIQALAFRQQPGGVTPAAGTPVLADIWRMIVTSGEVLPGDVLTSTTVSGYMFGVATAEPWYDGYVRCALERRR